MDPLYFANTKLRHTSPFCPVRTKSHFPSFIAAVIVAMVTTSLTSVLLPEGMEDIEMRNRKKNFFMIFLDNFIKTLFDVTEINVL